MTHMPTVWKTAVSPILTLCCLFSACGLLAERHSIPLPYTERVVLHSGPEGVVKIAPPSGYGSIAGVIEGHLLMCRAVAHPRYPLGLEFKVWMDLERGMAERTPVQINASAVRVARLSEAPDENKPEQWMRADVKGYPQTVRIDLAGLRSESYLFELPFSAFGNEYQVTLRMDHESKDSEDSPRSYYRTLDVQDRGEALPGQFEVELDWGSYARLTLSNIEVYALFLLSVEWGGLDRGSVRLYFPPQHAPDVWLDTRSFRLSAQSERSAAPAEEALPLLAFHPVDMPVADSGDLDMVQIAPDYAFTSWELTFAGPSDAPCYWLECTLVKDGKEFPVAIEFCRYDVPIPRWQFEEIVKQIEESSTGR